uniref:Serpentine receptor class gamma n=1 Tax=Strongyloides papillosus TaxID=174720 RepID=A0A0N5BVW6_STREA
MKNITKKDKDGANAFYKTYIIGFIGNLLEILKTKIFYTIPSFGWFLDFYKYNPIPLYLLPILGYTCTFISILGIFCLSLNRVIAVLYPIFYRIKWSHKTIYITLIIQFITPFIIFSYEFGRKVELKYDIKTKTYVYGMKEPEISKVNNIVASILSAIILIFQLILCYIIVSKSNTLKNKNSHNSSLITCCCLGTIGILVVSIRFWTKLFATINGNKELRNFAQLFGTYSSTISTTCQPYLLLLTSKKLRHQFFNFACLSSTKNKKNKFISEISRPRKTNYSHKFKNKVDVY